MATISPAISTTLPAVQATIPGSRITYAQLMASLGPDVYKISEVYYASTLPQQFAEQFYYSAYDGSGATAADAILTPISPSQFQDTLYLDMKGKGVIANGETALTFNLVAGNLIQFIFWGNKNSVTNGFNNSDQPDTFKSIESAMGKPGFFEAEAMDKEDQARVIFVEG